jgi:ribosomal protein L22
MVKYSKEPEDQTKSCKARGSDLRTHFKNMRETAMALKKMELGQAKHYLEEVIAMRRCIVFRCVPRRDLAAVTSAASRAFRRRLARPLAPSTGVGASVSRAARRVA